MNRVIHVVYTRYARHSFFMGVFLLFIVRGSKMPEKEVEEMKEFMNVLMDVKVSMAQLNGKVDKILSLEEKVNKTYDIAVSADRRSIDNANDIEKLEKKLDEKASKEDVGRMVKDRENRMRNFPAYGSMVIALAALIYTLFI